MPQLLRLLIRHKHKVVRKQFGSLSYTILLRLLGRHSVQGDNERVLDTKDGVGGFVGGTADIQGTDIVSCMSSVCSMTFEA